MKDVYGYIRVSTAKQGTGVSLQEQREAIIRYADRHQLRIVEWFEELETAAKQGRPLFTKLMKLLQSRKADGVIIHKIDRSARNLKDWAALGDLIDQAVEVHFAHESFDMKGRGGRLAADIQAVIASDYIRNLREEALKGLYGRLKQGIYPFGAPIGYINNGGGKVKTIDPVKGPLVKKAFQLYASKRYNLETLTSALVKLGLRNSKGNQLGLTSISCILNNPFYTGVIKVKGKTFQGNHEPLISPAIFSEVQDILRGKTNSRPLKHDFLFRKLVKCAECGYSLIGEKQKGHVYYRCHSRQCQTKGLREEAIESSLIEGLNDIQLDPVENKLLNEFLKEAQVNWSGNEKRVEESLEMRKSAISKKLDRLTDAYIENVIDKSLFEAKKEKILIELQGLRTTSQHLSAQKESIFREAADFLELIKSFRKSYSIGIADEKRKIMKTVTSNFAVQGKKLMISMRSPFHEIANRFNYSSSVLDRTTPRTCTPEIASVTTNGDNFDSQATFVADLAIDPATKQVDFSNSHPIASFVEDTSELRERMKQLLDIIMEFFEEERKKVESGELKEEDQLQFPYVQEDDPSTKHTPRLPPKNPYQRRA